MSLSVNIRRVLACAALSLAGCQLVLGFEDFEAGGGDAAVASGGTGGRGGRGGTGGAGGDGERDGGHDGGGGTTPESDAGGGPATPPCELLEQLDQRFDGVDAALIPSDRDEDMVEVRRPDDTCFLMDRLEVSVGQYRQLLDNDDAAAQADDGPCTFKTELSPPGDATCGDPSAADELPATCVDWCDARRYCRFRGLELCRGEFASEAQMDAMRNDWYAACSDGGERVYPYGDVYDATLCESDDNPASSCPDCTPSEVTAHPSCVAASGARNLSGNAAEWTGACRDATGANDSCRANGGSFRSPYAMNLTCESFDGYPRDTRADNVGFRCCFYAD